MAINEKLIQDLMWTVRTKSDKAIDEIKDLVNACKKDLEIAGVYISDDEEPLFKQALKLYCKTHYGYDSDTEKFQSAYNALKDAMALSGDYKKGDNDGRNNSTVL